MLYCKNVKFSFKFIKKNSPVMLQPFVKSGQVERLPVQEMQDTGYFVHTKEALSYFCHQKTNFFLP